MNPSLLKEVKNAITSPAVLTGLGVNLVGQDLSSVSKSFLLISLIVAIKNTQSDNNVEQAGLSKESPNTYQNIRHEKLLSPGLPFIIHSTVYSLEGVLIAKQNPMLSTCFFLYGLGSAAYASISNQSFNTQQSRTRSTPEKLCRKLWGFIPNKVQTVLENPGFSLSSGTLILNVLYFNFTDLAKSPLLMTTTVASLIIMGSGILSSMKPLLGKDNQLTGDSCLLGGVARIGLAATSLFSGNVLVGLGTLCFAGAMIKMGCDLKSKFLTLFQRRNR